jgi:large subunit ribosomal protein L19
MQELLVDQKPSKRIPDLRAGMTVRVHQKIKEGEKERVQIFQGLIIKMNSGAGVDKTFTVRNIVSGVGVEKIFPIYSPNVVKIEVKKKAKIRRAKLYYMRERSGKSARLKEEHVHEEDIEKAVEELAEQKAKEDAEKAKAEGAEPIEEVVEEAPAKEEEATEEAAPEAEEAPKEEAKPEAEEKPAEEEAPAEEKAE